jgi:uncharacterized protein (TIGR00730 family)
MKSVCVYCGSNPGRLPAYAEAARRLGAELVERGLGLVYGGASVGVMAVLADTVLQLGGHVTGVIPEALVRREVAHSRLSQLRVTGTMHERKTLMAELADGFVALPGGIGTLEEVFEAWTWAQLGLHGKPCGLLNVAGYFDGLIAFLDHAVSEGFVKEPHRSMLVVSDDPADLLDRFEAYEAPAVRKWISRGDA